MAEKLKSFFGKAKEVLGKVSKKVWIALAAVLVVMIAAIVIVTVANSKYVVLMTDLNRSDLNTIVSYLESQGVKDFRVENNDTILVPESMVSDLQMKVYMQGYGTSGFAYEYYTENVGMLSTEKERENAWLISVEQKMRACIITLENVRDAQVNLAQGEDSAYVLDSANAIDASASVLVEMNAGKTLTNQQAQAIRMLVAGGVQGLEIDNVLIMDTVGNTYSVNDLNNTDAIDSSALKWQMEEKYNNLIRTNVMQVLMPVFGAGNVNVSVRCEVVVDRMTQASTEINHPEWATDGEGIIGSKIWDNYTITTENGNDGGEVGTESNSEIPGYVEGEDQPDGTEKEHGSSGQIDYDNPTTETYTERTAAYMKDCTVSVSINTDGLTEEQATALRMHVAYAAGIPETNVHILPWLYDLGLKEQVPGPFQLEDWMIIAIAGGVLLLVLIVLIAVSSAKKKKRKQKEAEMLAAMQQQALEQALLMNNQTDEEELSADVMNMKNEKSMALRKDIRRFADESPEIAAQIVKSLLRGGENDG